LVNRHISQARRRSAAEVPVAEPSEEAGKEPDVAVAVAERDRVRLMLNALPVRARTVLVLRYYADLSDHQIAEMLDISPSTVRSTASRALGALRQLDLSGPGSRPC
jgi:RNA polymerase sigma factor (sigma-70 family)